MAGEGSARRPAGVFLAYPTLHAVQRDPDAALRAALDANPDADRFGPDAVRGMYQRYLGDVAVEDAPVFAVPGRATTTQLAEFPRTLMINDEVDELRVSGETFAETLAEAGAEVRVEIEPATTHGHLNQPHHPGFDRTLDTVVDWMRTL